MRKSKRQRPDRAKRVLLSLLKSSGNNKKVRGLSRKVLSNFKENPPGSMGDFFIVLHAKDVLLVKSGERVLEETFGKFWIGISEWAWVELHWWCDDQKIPKDPCAERDVIVNAVKPALFALDMKSGIMEKIESESSYKRIRNNRARLGRQFFFIDTTIPSDRIFPLLEERIREVHG